MTVWTLFQEQAQAHPDCVAVEHGKAAVSYGRLHEWADEIAREMCEQSTDGPRLTAIDLPYAPELIAALLACRKLGRPYLAIGAGTPPAVAAEMLECAGATCVIRADEANPSRVRIEPRSVVREAAPVPEGTFHISYTSGSTGRPKGVVVSESAVLNRLRWMWRDFPFADGAVMGIHKDPSLVASPWELFGGLLAGRRSIMIPRTDLLDGNRFRSIVQDCRISHLFLVPSVLRVLTEAGEERGEGWASLTLVTSGADRLPVDLARRFLAAFPHVRLLNLYGLTECSSNIAAFDVAALEPDAIRVPVGTAVAGAQIEVLDDDGRPSPPGAVGQIVVSGPPLADGYHGDCESTAERFTHDEAGRRIFRTGDLGQWLSNGALDIVGRVDTQVKVRGYRVELEHVEAVLSSAPGAPSLAVVHDPAGDGSLTALVEGDVDVEELRRYALANLTPTMVPRSLKAVGVLPRSANGKVDRLAIARLAERSVVHMADGSASSDAVESAVVALWSRLLDAPPRDRDQDFFEAGGDSLLALELIGCLEEEDAVEVSVRAFFDRPTVAGIGAAVQEARRLAKNPD